MGLRRGVISGWCPSLGPTGGTLLDRFSRNNHGTLTNMSVPSCWVISGGKYALDLDGVNDYVEVTDRTSIEPPILTFSLWVRPRTTNQASYSTIAGKAWALTHTSPFFSYKFGSNFSSNASGPYSLEINISGTLRNVTGSFGPSSGRLDFLCGTYDGAILRLYLNGRLDGSASFSGTVSYGVGNFRIGANAAGQELYNGNVDDILVYDRPLSATEVWQLYQLGPGGHYKQRRRAYGYRQSFRRRQYGQLVGGGLA